MKLFTIMLLVPEKNGMAFFSPLLISSLRTESNGVKFRCLLRCLSADFAVKVVVECC